MVEGNNPLLEVYARTMINAKQLDTINSLIKKSFPKSILNKKSLGKEDLKDLEEIYDHLSNCMDLSLLFQSTLKFSISKLDDIKDKIRREN